MVRDQASSVLPRMSALRGRHHVAGLNVAQINVRWVEDQVRDLLHHAGDLEIGAELFGELDVAAAAGLQIALVSRRHP